MCSLLPNCLQVQGLKRDQLQAWCDARGIAPNEQLRTAQKQERLVKALNVEYRAEKQAQQSYLKAQKEAEELVSHCSDAKRVQAASAAPKVLSWVNHVDHVPPRICMFKRMCPEGTAILSGHAAGVVSGVFEPIFDT